MRPETLSRRQFACLSAAGLFGLLLPGSGIAAPSAIETARAVNIAGRQRMLSQRMARAAFFFRLGVEEARHIEMLGDAAALFDKSLAGLRDGSSELGLATETNARVLEGIGAVEQVWEVVKPAIDSTVEARGLDDDAMETIATANIPLLFASDNVVDQLVWTHGKSSGDPGLAVAINISGRQRMLSQKMAKEVAMIALGSAPRDTRRSLGETAMLFDQSLKALINGMPALQIPKAPEHIRQKLTEVAGIWVEYGKVIGPTAAGAEVGPLALTMIAAQADPLLTTMNDAVTLYQELATTA